MKASVEGYLEQDPHWKDTLIALRRILLTQDLEETIKWGKPTYTYQGRNVAIIQSFKDHLSLMFFKGVLLEDPKKLLQAPGEDSHIARRLLFTSPEEVEDRAEDIKHFLLQAIELEKAGVKVTTAPKAELELVPEFLEAISSDHELSDAFYSLTPGRQREYHLHIKSAKQAATRINRIEKIAPRIKQGRGLRD